MSAKQGSDGPLDRNRFATWTIDAKAVICPGSSLVTDLIDPSGYRPGTVLFNNPVSPRVGNEPSVIAMIIARPFSPILRDPRKFDRSASVMSTPPMKMFPSGFWYRSEAVIPGTLAVKNT